jgi:hypothetical protein
MVENNGQYSKSDTHYYARSLSKHVLDASGAQTGTKLAGSLTINKYLTTSTKLGLEVETEKQSHMLVSRHENL